MTDKPACKELTPIREIFPNSFIFEKENALADDLCDEMIRRFEASEGDQYPGRIDQTVSSNHSVKKTTDRALFQSLGRAILEFREKYIYFKGPFKNMGCNLQRYTAGEH